MKIMTPGYVLGTNLSHYFELLSDGWRHKPFVLLHSWVNELPLAVLVQWKFTSLMEIIENQDKYLSEICPR